MLKAKTTAIDSIVYRSKTEAITAYVFEQLKISFAYESTLFETELGHYLPDFYLFDYDIFVEIKGSKPTQEEIFKAQSVAKQTCRPVLILSGAPKVVRDGWPSDRNNGKISEVLHSPYITVCFPDIDSCFSRSLYELYELGGVDLEMAATELCMVADITLEGIWLPQHIHDLLLQRVVDMKPSERYKIHKETPAERKFEQSVISESAYLEKGLSIICALAQAFKKRTNKC